MFYSVNNSRNYIKPCLYVSFFFFLSLFFLLPGTPVLSGTIDLPQTGQTSCYNTAGASISCNDTGQDGDLLTGVAWPGERFTLYNNCIIDNLTGLMWSRYAYLPTIGLAEWAYAAASVNPGISLCGLADWRLPNINELQSLVNVGAQYNDEWLWNYFYPPQSVNLTYWSSTTWAPDSTNAWTVNMIDGSVLPKEKLNTYYFWPVRSHQTPVAELWATGQTTGYANYDDGYLKKGTAWPDPRFEAIYCDSTGKCADQGSDCDAESSNNIVTDNLTGLVWSADANLNGLKTWSNALSYANNITTCGYGDWRLPNSKELFSLIDRSRSGPALPAEHPFVNIQSGVSDIYWSSTSYAGDPDMAWAITMFHGALGSLAKTGTAFVWPVRGGETEPFVLTVKKLGNGQGTLTANGLSCSGKTCRGEYQSYEAVTVTAEPQPGSVFTGWDGDACSGVTDVTCTITVTANMTIAATFRSEVKISVTPKSLNFKNLKQNIESPPFSVIVTNEGVENMLISPLEIVEDPTSVFEITSNPAECAVVTSGASCTITVTATSPDYDTKTAKLQISSNDPKKPTTIVRLKAKAKPPKIAKKPASLNFGKVTVGVPIDKILTITNKGITDLEIPFTGVISKTGDNPDDFSFSPATCPPLATGATCTLTVTFTPAAEGKRSAILQIPSNDPKRSTLSVKLGGVGQ